MSPAVRSVLVVNRASLVGTAMILILSAGLLTATGAWLDAGLRDADLLPLVTVASSFAGTVLIITAFVVAGAFSGALRQRRQEFALLRAVGATATQVRATVTAEALVLLGIVLPIGAAVGFLVAPLLTPLLMSSGVVPAGFTLPLSPFPVLATLIVLPTGLLSARAAARGILRVSPTAAVRDSSLDPTTISRGRRLTATGLGVAGVLIAGTPFFVPGTIGAAAASTSAILLIIAAALAGPVLVRWAAVRSTAVLGKRGAARLLAVTNARGFSHRLSSVVIPLALLVALGSVQSGVNTAVTTAGAQQLQEGLHADLVASSPSGVTARQASRIAALPGVAATTATGHLAADVRAEAPDDDLPALDRLNWESTTLRTISPGEPLLDPDVRSGSLRELESPGTIAVSREAILLTGKGIGDTVDVRVDGHEVGAATIVAIYERGLGFGDYLIGTAESSRLSATTGPDAVLIESAAGFGTRTAQAVSDMGLTVTNSEGYADGVTQDAGGQQRLSLVLLLALLGFLAAASANTLRAWIRSRSSEFSLLMRMGTTRRQVLAMVTIETVFVTLTAVAIGILAVLPALIGVGQGLFGMPLPVFDLPVAAALVLATVLIASLTAIPAAWRATSFGAQRPL